MKTIIHKPLITEQTLRDAQNGIFTFVVAANTGKAHITHAIESLFAVHVRRITTVRVKGKRKMVGKKRNVVKKPDWKKARVTLKKGESIQLFEVGKPS